MEQYQQIDFFSEVSQTQSKKILVSCVRRRLLQERIPIEPNFFEGRHDEINQIKEEKIEFSDIDLFIGILRDQNKKENVLLSYSSLNSGDVYDIINGMFKTCNEEDSYFEAPFYDNKSFLVKNYEIRGRNYGDHNQLKSWKLKGKRESDGTWVTFDKQMYEEKVKLIRLTQIGKNTSNNYILPVNGFEIFGSIFE